MIAPAASIETAPPATADRWVLVLAPEPGEVPVGRRVAQVLRFAKRRQGLKCIEVSSFTPDEQIATAREEIAELRAALAKAQRPRKATP